MPRVQKVEGTTVEPRATPVPRLTPTATEETFGGGASVQKTGEAASGLSNTVAAIAIQQKKNADELRAQDADIQLGKLETDLQIAASQMKGVDAAGAQGFIDDSWKKGNEEITKGVTSDYAKRLISAKSAARYDSLYKFTQLHMAKEYEQHEIDSANALITNEQNAAGVNYNNPERIKQSLITQYGTIDRLAQINGWSKEERALEISKAQDATVKSVIDAYLGNGDSEGAKQFFESNKSLISDGKITKQYIENKANQIEVEKEAALKQYFETNDQQTQLDFFEGKLNLSELQRRRKIGIEIERGNAAGQGGINKSTYSQYQTILIGDDYKQLQNKLLRQSENGVVGNPVTEPSVFNTIRQTQLNPDRTQSQAEITKLILDNQRQGKLSKEDAKYLTIVNKGLPPTPAEEHAIEQANYIKDYALNYLKDDQKAEELKMEFLKRVENEGITAGPKMDEVAKEIMETAVKKRFQIPNLTELPHIVMGIKDGINNLMNPSQKSGIKPNVIIKRNSDGSLTMYRQGQQEQKPKK